VDDTLLDTFDVGTGDGPDPRSRKSDSVHNLEVV